MIFKHMIKEYLSTNLDEKITLATTKIYVTYQIAKATSK